MIGRGKQTPAAMAAPAWPDRSSNRLARRLQLEQQYCWLVNLIGVAALLCAALLSTRRHRLAAALCVMAAGFLLAPALVADGMPLAALYTADQHASWLIPGFVALALALGVLSTQQQGLVTQTR